MERITCDGCEPVCQCPPCIRWWYHLYGITSSRPGFIENYRGPSPAQRDWSYSTPRVEQVVDFSLRLPVEDIVCEETRSVAGSLLPVPPPPVPPHRVFSGPARVPSPTVPAPAGSAWSHAEGIQPEFDPLGPLSGQEDRDFDRYPTPVEVAVEPVYRVPGPGGPRLLAVDVHPVTGDFRLRHSGLSPGRTLAVRYWHVSGLSPNSEFGSFRQYGGSWIRPPAPGLYEFQLAAVAPGLPPLLSNSVQRWHRVEEFFHRPFAESRQRVPPLRLVMPPTTTPQPTPVSGTRPARPFISVASQDYSRSTPSIRIVVPSSPPGRLEYRYWRHTGHLPPADVVVWHSTAERDFVIEDLPPVTVLDTCLRHLGVPEDCPIRVPVFWDVQVRVVSGLVSDLSPARSVLVYGVAP